MSSRIDYYADAFLTLANAEGDSAPVEAELFQVAMAIESSDELRATLTDAGLPAARRQQVVEDLLSGRASPTTIGIVSMVVAAGRASDLPEIVRALTERAAAARNKAVAEVRSAVPLTPDQAARLTEALSKATGKDVEIKVVIDPSVLGGIVTQIGDTVIDGSVRHRLNKMREVLA
jgi:F-type H+-transporting ATPase subunit delta